MIQALYSRALRTLFHGPCAANLFMNLIGQSIRCWPPLIVVFGCSDKQSAFSQSLYEGLIAPSFPQALWELRFPQSLWERYTLTNHARRMASISNHYCWYFGTNCPPEKNVECWYHYQSINGMNLSSVQILLLSQVSGQAYAELWCKIRSLMKHQTVPCRTYQKWRSQGQLLTKTLRNESLNLWSI